MNRSTVRSGVVALVVTAALGGAAMAGAGTTAAGATAAGTTTPSAGTPIQTVTANFVSGPFNIQFTAKRALDAAPTTATGTFYAKTALGSATLLTLAGPVTCLDVVGNQIGLFYAVGMANPDVVYDAIHGIYIYVELTKAGKPAAVNFVPSTSSVATSCPPLPGISPITSGTVTVTNATPAPAPMTTLGTGTAAGTSNSIVVNSTGQTVYALSPESARHPLCTKASGCLKVWPPVTVASSRTKLTAAPGVKGKLGTVHRNGIFQVTLAGHPLYRFAGDRSTPGAANGQGIHSFGGTWHTVPASGATTPTTPTTPANPYPYG